MTTSAAQRWRISDEASLQAVIAATFDEVSRLAARLAGRDRALAEDLVQDTYVGLVRSIREDRLDEVGLGWLLTAVRHRFVDHHRRLGRLDRSLRLAAAADRSTGTVPDGPSDAAVTVDLLRPLHRLVLVMHDVDGFTSAEIAAETGIGKRTVEAALAEARRAARLLLEGDDR
jgi:RNA polymerase sigma-70 factor (ECF subfamily)